MNDNEDAHDASTYTDQFLLASCAEGLRKLWTSERKIKASMTPLLLKALKLTAWSRRPDAVILDPFLHGFEESLISESWPDFDAWADKVRSDIKTWEAQHKRAVDIIEEVDPCDNMFHESNMLPPKRGKQCEVHSQQDASLLNIGMNKMLVLKNARVKQ